MRRVPEEVADLLRRLYGELKAKAFIAGQTRRLAIRRAMKPPAKREGDRDE